MYRTIEDFISAWSYESGATLKIFNVLTDESLKQKVEEQGRSLGFLAWHIVLTLGEMGEKTGLSVECPPENAQMPSSAKEIAAQYEIASRSLLEDIKKRWNDASLVEEVNMYGEKWTRGYSLASLVKHQIHHRAQMTILMRQAGLKVPGLYGPAREEWAAFGMKAQP
jgi:uncharacterized damage-inducible protein DinB